MAGGDLDGVEEEAGATVVDTHSGEARRDRIEGLQDGFAGVERGKGEGIVGDDGDGGFVRDAVVVTGELVAAGVGAATDAVGVPMHALMRLVGIEFGFSEFVHGLSGPPGGYIKLSGVK